MGIKLLPQGTVHADTPVSAAVLGVSQATFSFQPVQELAKSTDFEKRSFICIDIYSEDVNYFQDFCGAGMVDEVKKD